MGRRVSVVVWCWVIDNNRGNSKLIMIVRGKIMVNSYSKQTVIISQSTILRITIIITTPLTPIIKTATNYNNQNHNNNNNIINNNNNKPTVECHSALDLKLSISIWEKNLYKDKIYLLIKNGSNNCNTDNNNNKILSI